MRKKNQLKRKIAHGDYVIGTWCTLPSPSVINVLGASGLDFVIIDMEHGPTDFVTAEDMIRSAESEECSPLIRVPSNNESDILRALDIGAHGIIVPNIESVDDREKAVSYIKYPPSGIRGFSPYTRAGNYSNLDSNYTAKENKETMTVLIVEGIEGLKNLEGIINDPQIDVIYIGTYDLSQAIGKPGKVNHIQVKEELEECVKKYNIKNFFFRADTFTWDEKWVIEICKLIIERKLQTRWGTNSRADTISKERLEWMKRAGCWIIGFGIESGDQKSLDLMKKKTTLEDANTSILLCKEYGIKTYTLFLIGLPWDNRETIKKTIKFARHLDGDYIDINIAYPLPGTEMFEMAKKENLFNETNIYGYDYSKPLIKTRYLSTEELVSMRKWALLSFYLRPHYIIKTIASIRSPKVLINYVRAGLQLLCKTFSAQSNVSDLRE